MAITSYAMTDATVEEEKEIKTLLPEEEWSNLSMDALIEQKNILFDRWMFLVEKKYPYAADVKKGLDKIDKFIAEH